MAMNTRLNTNLMEKDEATCWGQWFEIPSVI